MKRIQTNLRFIENYQDINWHKCQEELLLLQELLVEAYRAKETRKVKDLQRQIVTSFAARALAVKRVTLNKGGKTSGVDGVTWPTPKHRLNAIEELRYLTQNPKLYRAKPVRRVSQTGQSRDSTPGHTLPNR
jgi:RNA-directed DNA polymerase